MSSNALLSLLSNKPPRYRSRGSRLLGLLWGLARRAFRRAAIRIILFGGWVWFAAGSLIGFEAFDIVFGMFALAPELLPFVIFGLALTWYFRRHVRRVWTRAGAYRRLRHMDRDHD